MGTQEKINLTLPARTARKKKVRALRREGVIPGVVYGKGLTTRPVQVGSKDLDLVYRKMHGTSIIDASLEGETMPVLIHEVHRDKMTGSIIHVDFLKVDLTHDVTVEVPLVFVGMAPAEKEGRGKVGHEATTILIKCPPASIPAEISVDVTVIKDKHDVIHASDLKLPEGASLGHGVSPDKVIAHLSQAKFAEAGPVAEAAAAEEGAAAPAAAE
jgi:large subunit ribosomal protein L25